MRSVLIGFLILWTSIIYAQPGMPYWKEINDFKTADSLHPSAYNQVLFIGSSSFTMWHDVAQYFPKYSILNRAFGGSTLKDQLRYFTRLVPPYRPAMVMIYCGENDFAENEKLSVDVVVDRFTSLFEMIRCELPSAPIVYVSMKPSPSRQHLVPKFQQANTQIQQYLSRKALTGFIDTYQLMTDADGHILSDIWLEDRLHMNAKGYALWQPAIAKYLEQFSSTK